MINVVPLLGALTQRIVPPSCCVTIVWTIAEAETGTAIIAIGGEERIEYFFLRRFVDAFAIVGEGYFERLLLPAPALLIWPGFFINQKRG
jgi:hypothetical protein